LESMGENPFVVRELDLIAVKGKTEPVRIFELVGIDGQVEPHVPDLIAQWNRAMELYHQRDFEHAAAAFEACLEIHPSDPPAKVYVERSHDLAAQPPAPEWDGVFVM